MILIYTVWCIMAVLGGAVVIRKRSSRRFARKAMA